MGKPRDDMEPGERLAHQLLDAMDFDRRFDRRFVEQTNRSAADGPDGDATQAQLEALHQIRRSILTPERIRPHLAAYYSEQLTEAELRQLIDFFESPVGRKFVAVWGSEHGPVREIIAQASQETREQYRKFFDETLRKRIRPADE